MELLCTAETESRGLLLLACGGEKQTRIGRIVLLMGGHGGLNITHEKSYNPYGANNRARVEADERAAAEASAQEHQHRVQQQRDERRRALLNQYFSTESASDTDVAAVKDSARTLCASGHGNGDATEDAKFSKPDERMRLGSGMLGNTPWYAREPSSTTDHTQQQAALQEQHRIVARRENLPVPSAPMSEPTDAQISSSVCTHAHASAAVPSFEALRQERREREAVARKARALAMPHDSSDEQAKHALKHKRRPKDSRSKREHETERRSSRHRHRSRSRSRRRSD